MEGQQRVTRVPTVLRTASFCARPSSVRAAPPVTSVDGCADVFSFSRSPTSLSTARTPWCGGWTASLSHCSRSLGFSMAGCLVAFWWDCGGGEVSVTSSLLSLTRPPLYLTLPLLLGLPLTAISRPSRRISSPFLSVQLQPIAILRVVRLPSAHLQTTVILRRAGDPKRKYLAKSLCLAWLCWCWRQAVSVPPGTDLACAGHSFTSALAGSSSSSPLLRPETPLVPLTESFTAEFFHAERSSNACAGSSSNA